jgi:thiamine-phosphate pyrophosphorylase
VRAIQLREKDLSGKDLFVLAERVRRLTERHGARVFINDRIDVALAVDADGVQLGEDSIGARDARTLLGAERMIGVSTHSLAGAERAQQEGADFALFGPVYFTPSKADYGAPQGIAAFEAITAAVSLPVYAIGGISSENLAETIRAGARGVALISAIIAAEDPRAATESLLTLLRSGRRNAR